MHLVDSLETRIKIAIKILEDLSDDYAFCLDCNEDSFVEYAIESLKGALEEIRRSTQ